MKNEKKYHAFISYRHTEPDRTVACKLQELLERYKPPKRAAETDDVERNGMKPAGHLTIFRDDSELATALK